MYLTKVKYKKYRSKTIVLQVFNDNCYILPLSKFKELIVLFEVIFYLPLLNKPII